MLVNRGQLFGSLQCQYFDRSLRQVRGHMPIKAQAVFLSALDDFRAFLTNGNRLSAAAEYGFSGRKLQSILRKGRYAPLWLCRLIFLPHHFT